MANNKVQLSDGTVLLDLTGDTVTPETLMSGATAHDAAGERIVGVATAGGGITNFPTIEEVRANWAAVNLVTDPIGSAIHFTSSIILALIIGVKEGVDRGILFLEVKQDQDFEFCNLCNEDGRMYVFDLYLASGAIAYGIMLSDAFNSGEVIPDTTIQSVIYYTTADNFFSK